MAGELPEDYVGRLARAKAEVAWHTIADAELVRPVLAADTAVVIDNRILGKPRDQEDGLSMLHELSGRCHLVLTAVAVVSNCGRIDMALSRSEVCFRVVSEMESLAYWRCGESVDKAGAYAIQGHAAAMISSINGSYSGVMGLPLYETAQLLTAAGIKLFV